MGVRNFTRRAMTASSRLLDKLDRDNEQQQRMFHSGGLPPRAIIAIGFRTGLTARRFGVY